MRSYLNYFRTFVMLKPDETMEEFTKANTLYLPIQQIYYDQIIAGTKKIEYRDIKDTTASRYYFK